MISEVLCDKQKVVLLFQFRICTAPFHYVGFADFWLADQLNSLTTVLLDLEFLVCFYATEVDWLGHTGESLAAVLFFAPAVLFVFRSVKFIAHIGDFVKKWSEFCRHS